ncbi:MAG: PQQ-like beta-propeller repeat protein [Planctomycetes bacterium]|nr:PQQ-like beta-propeller repeat protein [Planctomycetota bacterium]
MSVGELISESGGSPRRHVWGRLPRRSLTAIAIAAMAASAHAGDTAMSDWPHWRGPTGNGVSPDATPPVELGPDNNLRWKTAIPGRGSSSPVVLGPDVFVTSAVPVAGKQGELDFRLFCLDRATGQVRWSRTAVAAVPHEGTHQTHGFASASPCTDGQRVYAHFGSRGLHCFSRDGEALWQRDFGDMRIRNGFGEGSSPTLVDGMILVPWDHEGPSALHALDATTGRTVWETPRDEPTAWATPLVATDRAGGKQVVMNGQRAARGYDLATGKELWRCGGQTERPCASAVAADGVAIVASGFRGAFIGAFDLSGRGELAAGSGVLWTRSSNTPDVGSPLLSGDRVYYYKEKTGLLTCIDARTGAPHYEAARIPGVGRTYASPVAAGGHVYLTDRGGAITVIRDAPALEVVATNDIGEGVDATAALAGREVFIRGEGHLFCFARP